MWEGSGAEFEPASNHFFPQGADEVVVLGVNDFFVMKEFGKALGAGEKVSVSCIAAAHALGIPPHSVCRSPSLPTATEH